MTVEPASLPDDDLPLAPVEDDEEATTNLREWALAEAARLRQEADAERTAM